MCFFKTHTNCTQTFVNCSTNHVTYISITLSLGDTKRKKLKKK